MSPLRFIALIAITAFTATPSFAAEKPVKIYILAGQSNMNTFRNSVDILKKNYPDLEMPTKNLWYVEEAYRGGLPKIKEKRWGVETPFGIDMVKNLNEPVLLFKSSKGGSTLTTDWLPPSSVKRLGKGEVGYLYKRMIRRFHNMIKDIETICPPVKERGYEIAGFIWFQGESDCFGDPELWKDYEPKLKELIADVRRDVGVPELPFLNIQINNIPLWDGKPGELKGGAIIREIQKRVAEADPKGRWISTSNLSKGYHYDANAHFTIGKRMAEAMLPMAKTIVPTDANKTAAAGKAFTAREYPNTKPDVSSLKKGLIFYLPFDEDGKPTLKDSIGGLEGKTTGEAKYCEGLFGKGISIDRGPDRRKPYKLEYPGFKDPVEDGVIKSMSVSYWIRTSSGGDAVTKYASGKAHGSMNDGWRMTINHRGNTGMSAMIEGVNEWPIPPKNTAKPKKGKKPKKGVPYVSVSNAGNSTVHGDGVEWHHVVAVYDGKAKTMRAYVDAGLKQTGRQIKRGYWAENIPGKGIISSATPLTIHNSPMDEIAIWDRPLTADEIKALFNNGHGVKLK